jgi:Phage integrase SAM-like domain
MPVLSRCSCKGRSVKLAKNKYASLPKTSVASFEAGSSPLVSHFKLADGRLQKIDLQFFLNGTFPRPQIGQVCAEIFQLEMRHSAPATRKNTRRALKVFNDFLDWRAAGGPEQQISSTSELTTALLIEYQAYLETVCTLQENSAKNTYTSLTWFLGHLRVHRPEVISPDFRLPGCRFKYYRKSDIAGGIISVDDLKRIADAALKEVRQIREAHRRAISLLESATSQAGQVESGGKPKGYWKSLANFMHVLVKKQGIASRIPVSYRQLSIIHGHPSPRKLIGWYAPTSVNYFTPFLVLLLLPVQLFTGL